MEIEFLDFLLVKVKCFTTVASSVWGRLVRDLKRLLQAGSTSHLSWMGSLGEQQKGCEWTNIVRTSTIPPIPLKSESLDVASLVHMWSVSTFHVCLYVMSWVTLSDHLWKRNWGLYFCMWMCCSYMHLKENNCGHDSGTELYPVLSWSVQRKTTFQVWAAVWVLRYVCTNADVHNFGTSCCTTNSTLNMVRYL